MTAEPQAPQGDGGEQAAPAQDMSSVLEGITKLSDQMGEIIPALQQQGPDQGEQYMDYGAQQPYGGDQYGQFDQQFQAQPGFQQGYQQPQFDQYGNPVQPDPMQTNPYTDQYGQPVNPQVAEQQAMHQLQGFIQQQIQQGVQQAVTPIQQQLQERDFNEQVNQMETEFPELREQAAADAAVEKAIEFAEQIGRPDLAGTPGFVRLAYLAAKTGERAKGEIPAGTSQGVQLEGGGGATPQADAPDAAAQYLGEGASGHRPDHQTGLGNLFT